MNDFTIPSGYRFERKNGKWEIVCGGEVSGVRPLAVDYVDGAKVNVYRGKNGKMFAVSPGYAKRAE